MAKRETQETYRQVQDDSRRTNNLYNANRAETVNNARDIAPFVAQSREDLTGAYRGLMSDSPTRLNYQPITTPEAVNFNSVSNAGNIDAGALRGIGDRWREFSDSNGGIDPERVSAITGDINTIRGFGDRSSISDENISRLRGRGVYDEFADTGGLSTTDRANIKAQAISPIGSMATGMRDEMSRRLALTGGYGPGYDTANRLLARDTARGITDASLNANLGVMDAVNRGRLAGAAGIQQGENAVVGAQQSDLGRRQDAYSTAAGMNMQMQDMISRYKAMGLSGEQATAQAIADIEGRNIANANSVNMFNSSGQFNADTFNTGNRMRVDEFNTGNTLNTDRFNIENEQEQRRLGLGGLEGIYNTDLMRYENERDRDNALLGGQTQANLNYLGNQSGLATQPGIGGNIINAVGTAAGVGSMFFNPRNRLRAGA